MKHALLFFLTILCLLAVPDRVLSQDLDNGLESGQPLYRIGAKVGGSLSQFNQPGSIMTGNLGAYGRYQVLPYLQVQLDLLYDVAGGGRIDLQRDFSFLTNGFPEDDDVIDNVSYINRHVYLHTINSQLSARLGLPELQGAAVEPKFIIGASAAYIFRGIEKRDIHYAFDDGSRVILSNEKEEVGGDYQSFNVSLMGGIALDFNLPNNEVFTLSFIYHRGLADLNSIEIGQPENIEDLRLQRFSISFSYSIFNR